MSSMDTERLAELQQQLMELHDEGLRGRVHLELGRLWVRWGRLELAARHFQEALVLDPQLQEARQQLARVRALLPGQPEESRRTRLKSVIKRAIHR